MGSATENESKGKRSLKSLGSLSNLLKDQPEQPRGTPAMFKVTDIRPDPNQIRNGDDSHAEDEEARQKFITEELGPDVKSRGVKSPISLRSDPENPGKWLINHGENRWRATVWAELEEIPAFIDEDYTDYDNAKENTKRLDVSGRQMARFVARKLAGGETKKQIAEGLGISQSLVNQISNLLKMPPCIEQIYDERRCRDLSTIAELMTAYKSHPGEVETWLLEQPDEILRSAVKAFRRDLEEPPKEEPPVVKITEERGHPGSGVQDPHREDSGGSGGEGSGERDPNTVDFLNGRTDSERDEGGRKEPESSTTDDNSGASERKDPPSVDPDKIKRTIVQVRHDERPARILLDRRPPAPGWGFIKYDDDGNEVEVDLAAVQLVALVEG
ncbi:ParB/RepB/Spo0J family partition protein [Metapseudomonas furukawaii]|uniref:Chromosome (Plasmid) partitioning protein n=1 Tax=Metapseudomonas furukawaii TaxID=1149133 RepID=A0AAD1C615_METFU|nr:ParB/RepB/Spo0J family partition protein [Pseudomonas furukawaii]ELS24168.1 Chromosome (plasmid) partitioning protein ParB [Pseudomonas furukawaii]BAU77430.1 chromosome (plasmid) partitioning protein [Pseudomonas furukawaii]